MSARRQEQLRALGQHIADEQDVRLAAREAELIAPTGSVLRAARRRASRTRTLLAAGAIALVASLGLMWLRTRPLELNITGRAGWPVGDTVQTTELALMARFSDESVLELAPRTRARLLAVTHRGAELRLESGHAHVRVTPNRQGEWTLHAGDFAVHVTGTRFDLDYDARAAQLTVRMHEGKVLVTGCALATPRPLSAGQSLHATCRAGSAQLTQAQTAEPRAAAQPNRSGAGTHAEAPSIAPTSRTQTAPARKQPAPPKLATTPATAPAPTWQQLARAGKFTAAYALGRTVEHAQLSVTDLLLFGDTARLSAQATAALAAYAEVRRRDPHGDAAASAAFASGQVLFDQRAAYPEAARWFQTYLRERESGSLAREAHGRLVEALERAGEHDAARRTAEQYLRSYPSGPHAVFARTLLAAP